MASISDILLKEQENNTNIHLYKEGIFLKAYEYSAYLFVMHLKPYRVTAKYIKQVNQWICSVGFPSSILNELTQNIEFIEIEQNIDIIINKEINPGLYINWKENCISHQQQSKQEAVLSDLPKSDSFDDLRQQILSFQLSHKTPVECCLFLAKLQQELGD